MVSRSLSARRRGGGPGRNVRSGPAKGVAYPRRMAAAGREDASDSGPRVRVEAQHFGTRAVDCVFENALKTHAIELAIESLPLDAENLRSAALVPIRRGE